MMTNTSFRSRSRLTSTSPLGGGGGGSVVAAAGSLLAHAREKEKRAEQAVPKE